MSTDIWKIQPPPGRVRGEIERLPRAIRVVHARSGSAEIAIATVAGAVAVGSTEITIVRALIGIGSTEIAIGTIDIVRRSTASVRRSAQIASGSADISSESSLIGRGPTERERRKIERETRSSEFGTRSLAIASGSAKSASASSTTDPVAVRVATVCAAIARRARGTGGGSAGFAVARGDFASAPVVIGDVSVASARRRIGVSRLRRQTRSPLAGLWNLPRESAMVASENRTLAVENRAVTVENASVTDENRRAAAESRTVAGESRTVAGQSRTVAGESRTVAGESRRGTVQTFTVPVANRTVDARGRSVLPWLRRFRPAESRCARARSSRGSVSRNYPMIPNVE